MFGLMPSLISVWVMRQVDAQVQARLRMAMEAIAARNFSDLRLSADQRYIQGVGFIIGDITCRYNAHSNYIRCAVNPVGPCQECLHYEPKPFDR